MAKSCEVEAVVRDKYVGEKKGQLRHGYGMYHYDNKFFRYEGEWENGLKHGHGKFFLGDSGYYEGNFCHGEIEGHGYKVFGISKATYTGQFHAGEMHGQGLLRKPDGEQYEGSWVEGKRSGHGILTGSDGSIYEGSFYQNLRHGEGMQIYSNGDQYEGDWVAGNRHGSGMLRCADGTLYDGQWKSDVYHGEGSISHASGVTYKGLWSNGRPISEAVSLRLVGETEEICIEQGKIFGFSIECIDAAGNVTTLESGRSFRVAASKEAPKCPPPYRKFSRVMSMESLQKPVSNIQSFKLFQAPQNTDVDDTTSPKPLLSTTTKQTDTQMSSTRSKRKMSRRETFVSVQEEPDSEFDSNGNHQLTIDSLAGDDLKSKSLYPTKCTISFLTSDSQKRHLKSDVFSKKEKSVPSKEDKFLAGLKEPELIVSENGKAVFKDLFLSPIDATGLTTNFPSPNIGSCTLIVSEVTTPLFLGSHLNDLLVKVKILPTGVTTTNGVN